MKKLKNFQKYALSAEQASKVKGGVLTCYDGDGKRIGHFYDIRINEAVTFCANHHDCAGCF